MAAATSGSKLRRLSRQVKDPRQQVLLIEAGRIADRLDVLDRLISAGLGDVSALVAGRVLAEARQQATTLKGILAAMGLAAVVPVAQAAPAVQGGRSPVDQIADRRAARQAIAAAAPSS
jgi:hypothetical protein